MKATNDGLISEIMRTQLINREMVADYMKLVDSKLQGTEEAFLSKYSVNNKFSTN